MGGTFPTNYRYYVTKRIERNIPPYKSIGRSIMTARIFAEKTSFRTFVDFSLEEDRPSAFKQSKTRAGIYRYYLE